METFDSLQTWLLEAKAQSDPDVVFILIGNMSDCADKRQVSKETATEFCQKHRISLFVETSAKTGENVQMVFLLAAKLIFR